MISPRPFAAHQFALLHFLGVLSLSKSSQDPIEPSTSSLESDPDHPPSLILPQELIFNAFCYLTEQIHEVAKPHARLADLLSDISSLSTSSSISKTVPPLSSFFSSSTNTRRPTTRSSPHKSVSLSPNTTTRSLRTRGSHATRSITPPPSPSPPIVHGQTSTTKPPDSGDGDQKAAARLADRLKETLEGDTAKIQQEGFDALLCSMGEFKVLLGELDNPNSISFLDRTSPLGMWLRRAVLSLNTLPFHKVEFLLSDIVRFGANAVHPMLNDGSVKAAVLFSMTQEVPSLANTLQSRVEVFESYHRAVQRCDYSSSLYSVTRFFDYESHPLYGGSGHNKGMRQHALLNLANFHLQYGEFASARSAAGEGAKVARQSGDLICLNALASILRRITFEDTLSSERANHAEARGEGSLTSTYDMSREDPGGYVPPMDQLWDIRYGLASRIPLPALTCDLYRAKALHYASLTQRTNLTSRERRKEKKLLAQQGKDASSAALGGPDSQQRRLKWNRLDMTAWYGTAADLWEKMGQSSVAGMYRTMGSVTMNQGTTNATVIDIDPMNGSRIAILVQRAEELSDSGAYDLALAVLLAEAVSPKKIRMTVCDVQVWQRGIYAVLSSQAKRLGYGKVLQHLESISPSPVQSRNFPIRHSDIDSPSSTAKHREFPRDIAGPKYEPRDQSGLVGELESLIRRSEKLLDASQADQAFPLVLSATNVASLSDGQGLLAHQRRAYIQLARVQTAYRASDRAIQVLDQDWPGILTSKDFESTSYAKKVRADCLSNLLEHLMEEGKEKKAERVEADDERNTLEEAIELLRDATDGFGAISALEQKSECLMQLAKVLHRQGRVVERDRVAKEWQLTKDLCHDAGRGEKVMLKRVCEIEGLCAAVSGRVAASL